MATQAELAQGYNDFINAITSGNFGEAANVAAGLGFSPAETEAFIEANAPGLGFDPGIDIPSDVIASYFDAPPVSYGPPSPAVSPAVSNSISLTPAGIAALAPSANVSSPANVFSPADYGPPSPILDSPATTPTMTRPEQEEALMQAYAKGQVDEFIDSVLRGASTGDFSEAADILSRNAANPLMGEDVYGVASNLLNTDPRFAGLREQVGGVAYTPSNLKSFVESQLVTQAAPVTPVIPVTPEGAAAPPTAQTTPGPGQIYGIPRFERQAQSNVPFAPLRRGLAQLRPAMYMPGLTSGQAPLGGSGFTPESLRNAIQSMTAAGQTPADVAYQMDVGGVSPAELSAAIGTPVGQIQAQYNQSRPRGLFSTIAPTSRGLPEDFALQTGAYGAPISTFLAGPTAKVNSAGLTTAENNIAGALSPSGLNNVNANQVGFIGGDGSGSFESNPNSPGMSASALGNTIAQGINAFGLTSAFAPTLSEDPAPESVASVSSVGDSDAGSVGGGGGADPGGEENKEGGLIKMAAGGGPPKMSKLSAAEAGSTFNIADYIDDQGRLVGSMSKPIRDEYGMIIGFESGDLPLPIQRDVVFNPILARREEEERQRMRNMAKGGLASIAQDLADKGRGGDTMVAHISPQEAGLLKALGGAGTINPETGLPEFFQLFPKRGIKLNLGPLGNIKIGRKSSDLLLAAAAGYAGATGFMGLNPATAAIGYGGVRAAATGNLMEGIQAGLSAYGMGEGMQAYGVGSPAATTGTAATGTGAVSPGAGAVTSANVPIQGTEAEFLAARPEFGQATSAAVGDPSLQMNPLGYDPVQQAYGPFPQVPEVATQSQIAAREALAYNPLSNPEVGGIENLGSPFEYQAVSSDNAAAAAKPGFLGRNIPTEYQKYIPDPLLNASGTTLAAGTVLGSSLISGQQERAAFAAQQAAANKEREERKKRFSDLYARTLGAVPARSGGLMKLAGGGMTYMEAGGTTGPTGTPRDVTGTGDGMSDSVPATIEGVQEARLADGEFVIPADVVADIGNGSSDAGSKKLYDMMDRIRMARHGTTEQPPEIKAERLMPA